VNFYYARLKADQATPVYVSLQDAIDKGTPAKTIAGGLLKYISYRDTAIVDGGTKPDYFELKAGGWVSAEDVSTRISGVSRFQGLLFKRTPPNAFGWIVPLSPTTKTKQTPGYKNDDYTGHVLTEYDLVQVYAVQQVDNAEWYLIAPDEWLEGSLVARVIPNTTPPQGVTGGRWIEVNLFEQSLAVYDNYQLVFATLIASGVEPYWTRPGLFQVYKRLESTLMSGTFELDRSDFYYLEDVPWTMYFDEARALHGAYWRTRFGFPQSHGCVNLSPGDAHWLYDWAQIGDWVYVWDPSGKTPTDPKYYTYGAP
jgi:lipoprotein-anchoring transpeptidase ErfK/SrfK